MADIWLPGWQRVDLGPDGGPYDEMVHPKACVHTTEGSTLAGAEGAFRPYPPHLGYDPRSRTKRQYVALNRHSYAFRNGETDDEYIIQIEVVGFANQTHTWSEELYRNFAEDVIKPLEQFIGVPRNYLRFYRADEGIVLARKTSPVRLRPAALRNYSGWVGHQHMPGLADNGSVLPAGDDHWDPGGFLMGKAISFLEDDLSASDVWSFPISWRAPNMTAPATFTAAQWLVWTNYYAGMMEQLLKIIASNEANDLTEEKLNRILSDHSTRMLEEIKNATIDVDVTVGGQAIESERNSS